MTNPLMATSKTALWRLASNSLIMVIEFDIWSDLTWRPVD